MEVKILQTLLLFPFLAFFRLSLRITCTICLWVWVQTNPKLILSTTMVTPHVSVVLWDSVLFISCGKSIDLRTKIQHRFEPTPKSPSSNFQKRFSKIERYLEWRKSRLWWIRTRNVTIAQNHFRSHRHDH